MAGMMEGDPDWSRLSKTSGIDLMALRTKYMNMKTQGLTQAGAGPGSIPVEYGGSKQVPDDYGVMREMPPPYATNSDEPPIPSVDEQTMKDAQERLEKLDMVHVCHICHGTGIETYEYMHMSRQRNCENCEGEGTITRKRVGVAQHVDMDVRGGVEAVVAGNSTAAESTPAATAAAPASKPAVTSIAIELDDEEEEDDEGEQGGVREGAGAVAAQSDAASGVEAGAEAGADAAAANVAASSSTSKSKIAIVMDEEDSEDEADDVPAPN